MKGNGLAGWSVTLSDTRARAAVEARRYGIPPAMIEVATSRRSAGDWRGACRAADVDLHLDPRAIRRRHGALVAERLLADLRGLAPDLLRWHLPRFAHSPGQLREGLLIPLADYPGAGVTLTLAAATPRFALAAGQRIVLTVLEGARERGDDPGDPVSRAVLDSVHLRSADRYCLRRYRMFWDARHAPQLKQLCPGLGGVTLGEDVATAREITRLQDAGQAAAAWAAAGIDVTGRPSRCARPDEQQRLARWLVRVPVNLPLLVQRVREALPGAPRAAIRSGGGAIVLHGLDQCDGAIGAEAAAARAGRGLPVVPEAAWARLVDADLLRFGLLRPHEVHPLVAAALVPKALVPDARVPDARVPDARAPDARVPDAAPASDQERGNWLYAAVPGIEAPCAASPGTAAVLVRCGNCLHRVAQLEGRWQPVDHPEHQAREALLARLGGPQNPCRQATEYLTAGRHVSDAVESLLEHGRIGEALRLLREHAGVCTAPEDVVLPGGGTVGAALGPLRENTLRLRMVLSGVPPRPGPRSVIPPDPQRQRSRKGEPARRHR
jgi:hypothetical protein